MANQQAQYIVLAEPDQPHAIEPQIATKDLKAKRAKKHGPNKQKRKASLVVNLNKEQMRTANASSLRQRQSTQKSIRVPSRAFQGSA